MELKRTATINDLLYLMEKIFYADRDLLYTFIDNLGTRKALFPSNKVSVFEFSIIENFFSNKFTDLYGTGNTSYQASSYLKKKIMKQWASLLGLPIDHKFIEEYKLTDKQWDENPASNINPDEKQSFISYLYDKVKDKKAVLWINVDKLSNKAIIELVDEKVNTLFLNQAREGLLIPLSPLYLALHGVLDKDKKSLYNNLRVCYPSLSIFFLLDVHSDEEVFAYQKSQTSKLLTALLPFAALFTLFWSYAAYSSLESKTIGLAYYSSDHITDKVLVGYTIEYLSQDGIVINQQKVKKGQAFSDFSNLDSDFEVIRISKDPYAIIPNEINAKSLMSESIDTIFFYVYEKYAFGGEIIEYIYNKNAQRWFQFQVLQPSKVSFICQAMDSTFSPQIAIYTDSTGRDLSTRMSGSRNFNGVSTADTTTT